MKKVLLILFLFLGIAITSNAQYNSHVRHKQHESSLRYNLDPQIGLCVTGSGVMFTTVGFFTRPDYTWVQTTGYAGTWQKKPFMQQGARTYCIITGFTLTFTGLITMLAGR